MNPVDTQQLRPRSASSVVGIRIAHADPNPTERPSSRMAFYSASTEVDHRLPLQWILYGREDLMGGAVGKVPDRGKSTRNGDRVLGAGQCGGGLGPADDLLTQITAVLTKPSG